MKDEALSELVIRLGHRGIWLWWYQRRTLTGTGLTKKTAQGCTGKNLRMEVALVATSAVILAGFFCISQLE
jgi:hypothetical protein